MFPALICTHSLQTSKCLLSVNIFIHSPPSPPSPLPSWLQAQRMLGDPLPQSQQGWFWERALPGPSGQPTAIPDSRPELGSQQQAPLLVPVSIGIGRPGMAPGEPYPCRMLLKWSLHVPPLAALPVVMPALVGTGKCLSIRKPQGFPNLLNSGAPKV